MRLHNVYGYLIPDQCTSGAGAAEPGPTLVFR